MDSHNGGGKSSFSGANKYTKAEQDDASSQNDSLDLLEDPPSVSLTSGPVIFAALISSLTAATLGYDVGVMADAIDLIDNTFDMSHSTTELIVGSLNFIAAFGTLIAGVSSDKLGRKATVAICCTLYVIGTAVMTLALNPSLLIVGRVITGLGVGVAFVVTPVYITEITPPNVRGMLTTCFDISINVGILLGYITGFVVTITNLSDEFKWRLMLGLGGVVPIFVALSLSGLPESPRWLMLKGRKDEATEAMYRFLGDRAVTEHTIADIERSIASEHSSDAITWHEFFFPEDPFIRRTIILVVGLGFWQQATGSEAVLYYSGVFLKNAGLDSTRKRLLGYIGVGLCKLIPELVVMNIVDIVGRRPLIILSSAGVTLTIFALALTFFFGAEMTDDDDDDDGFKNHTRRLLSHDDDDDDDGTSIDAGPVASSLVVFFLCLYMAVFSFGMGPVTWLTASESMPLQLRAKGMTAGAFINRLSSGVVALTVLSTCDALGPAGFFFFYGAVSVIGTLWYSAYVPETKGLSLEAITSEGHRNASHSSYSSLTAERQVGDKAGEGVEW